MYHYAVVGRIPFDDEDDIFTFNTETPHTEDELIELFTVEIFTARGKDREEYAKDREESGESEVFVNAILSSDSPIVVRFWA